MEIKSFLWAALMSAIIFTIGAPAKADDKIALYAGPGVGYRALSQISENSQLTIYGCLPDGSWCDVGYHNHRGWVAGQFLNEAAAKGQSYIIDPGPYVATPMRVPGYHNQGNHHRRRHLRLNLSSD